MDLLQSKFKTNDKFILPSDGVGKPLRIIHFGRNIFNLLCFLVAIALWDLVNRYNTSPSKGWFIHHSAVGK